MNMGILLIIIGVILLILGEVIMMRMKKCIDEVTGKVVDIRGYKGNIKWSLFTTFNLIVEYKYNGMDMKANTLNAITCLTPNIEKKLVSKGIEVGKECRVLVNSDKPEDICTEYSRNPALIVGGIFIILFGILVLVLG